MDAYEAKENIQKLAAEIVRVENAASGQNRNLSSEEQGFVAECRGSIEELTKSLPNTPLTVAGGNNLLGRGKSQMHTAPYALVGPNGRKDYNSLFGNNDNKWTDSKTSFWNALFSGRHHPGLIRNAMTETTPADGGFLVPSETAAKIHSVSLENEIIMPNAYVQPMRTNSCKVPAMSIGDHSTALFGGFTASYTSEAGTISEASPKSRSLDLELKKLTGLIRFSAELESDVPGGMGQIEQLCGKGLSWHRDRAFLKGIGSGEPLGILNAPCLVTVEKEIGQKAGSIMYENLTKMMASMFAGSFSNSTWVFHQSCIPQLLSLSISVGTGGSFIAAMTESDGRFKILTRPCLFTEKTETLGTLGDALLLDMSQYIIGLKGEMRFETSIHVQFETDELLSRLIERHDGQPLWDSALTLADGTTEVSPFVILEARA